MSIRLLVADDHEVVRSGLIQLVQETEIEVVAEADNGEDTVHLAMQLSPDVAIVDVVMPRGDGLTVLPRLKAECPRLPVLIFSAHDNPTFIARAVALGAAGYLLKGTQPEEILQAIRDAAAGKTLWTREALRRVTGALATPRLSVDVEAPLTQRESEVLTHLAEGMTNKEIAQALHISYETVKEHVQHILRKIGVTDRTQAAVWAVRKKLV
ncbi:MAG: response regulator [Pirellulaceae bacterium]